MKFHEALAILATQDKEKGIYVYTRSDLRLLFADDSKPAFDSSLKNLVSKGLLVREVTNVYTYAHAVTPKTHCRELIAQALRPEAFNYVSMASAMALYDNDSPHITLPLEVMTTGRRGRFETSRGPIEFTHSHRELSQLIKDTKSITGHPLRYARKAVAERDIRRAGRRELAENENIT